MHNESITARAMKNPEVSIKLLLDALLVAALESGHDDEVVAEANLCRWLERALQMDLHEQYPNVAQA